MSSQHANRTRRLAVIPSDPIQAYVDKGTSSWLEEYYNPERVFDEVYALSPLETRSQVVFGMHVIPTTPEELPRRLMELQIDVVRAYGGYWPCDFATSGNANGIPVIVSVHDTNPALLNDSILAADEVLAVSNVVAQLLRDRGVPGNRIAVFGNRVNLKMFTPMRDPAAARDYRRRFPGKYSILHVGRKTPQKNLDTLLRALATLGEDFTLVTIGRGDSAVYQDLARQLHVDNRCEFLDSIPNESLPFFYSNCDVMCTPSRYEGFGLVFIEALACAAVVVTSDIDPLNTLIRDHETGILVKDFENPAALADAIRLAVTDQNLRDTIASGARSSIERFSKERVDAFEAGFYRWILAGRPKGERPQFIGAGDWGEGRRDSEEYQVHAAGRLGRVISSGDDGTQPCPVMELVRPTGRAKNPMVSLVLPTYNQESYLPHAIQSVLAQTYRDFELIVVDDGSTDGTREYLDQLQDERIRILHQENQRLPRALNAGFAAARGEFLTWVSSDNYCAPEFLERLVHALKARPEAGFACAGFAWIDDGDQELSIEQPNRVMFRTLLLEKTFGVAAFMYRRECQTAAGLYDPSLEGAEDLDMWLRITWRYPVVHIPETLYYYRLHDRSMTSVMTERVREARRNVVERIVTSWGSHLEIDALYPGIALCDDSKRARAMARADLGTLLLGEPWVSPEHAVLLLQQAVADCPDLPRLKGNLALALSRAMHYEEAERILQELHGDADPTLQNLIAELSAIPSHRDGAFPSLVDPLDLRTPVPPWLAREGETTIVWSGATAVPTDSRVEDTETAGDHRNIGDLTAALLKSPSDCAVLLQIGVHHAQRGELQQAHDACYSAIALNPDLPLAHAHLAGVLVQMSNYVEAETAARRACLLRPFNANDRLLCQRMLGQLCLQNGKPMEAIDAFSIGLVLSPGDRDSLLGLGLAYESEGELRIARRCFEMVLEIDPGDNDALQELRSLQTENGTPEISQGCNSITMNTHES